MNLPLISIITPSYNSAKFIAETIESVLAQTYTNWELLITDDCSTDNTVEIINKYVNQDSRIKLFCLGKNSGAATARNNSIEQAKGRFIAFLDSDDLWKPEKLEKQVDVMIKNNHAFTYTSYELINEDGTNANKVIKAVKSVNYEQYLKNTIIGCLTVVIDRELVGDFRMPMLKTSQDMATWLLVLKRGFVAYGIQDSLAYYRLVNNSNSSKKIKAAKDVWKVYRESEKLSFFNSLICFSCYAMNAILKRL